MAVAGEYHSAEKQKVREKLWDNAFNDLINQEKIDGVSLKYFCLPGAECIYLKQIFQKFGIQKKNIYAVEKYHHCGISIRDYLEGKSVVLIGELNKIIGDKFLDKAYPKKGFDVVNLDFCGQAFVFTSGGYPKRWGEILYFIKKNSQIKKNLFYLLLTIMAARDPSSGIRYLEETLETLNEITQISPPKDPSKWKHRRESKLIQTTLPSIIIDEALRYNYILDMKKFKSFSYQQSGHKSIMVAFSFKLKYNKEFERLMGPDKTRRIDDYRKRFFFEYFSKEPETLEKCD